MKIQAVIITASNMKKTIEGVLYSGKCITAFDLDNNRVIRLVSTPDGAPILNPECEIFKPLDVYDISITRACPLPPQTENVLADVRIDDYREKYASGISDIYDKFRSINRDDGSFILDGWQKINDASAYKHSLELIAVENLAVNDKKCSFTYRGLSFFEMSLTDPMFIGPAKYIGDAIIAVSIPTDNFGGKGYYKFVAAIYPGKPWTKEEDEELRWECKNNWGISLKAAVHKRTEKDILERQSYLGIHC